MKATSAPFPSGALRFATLVPMRPLAATVPLVPNTPVVGNVTAVVGTDPSVPTVLVPVVNTTAPITTPASSSGMGTGATIAIGLLALAAGVGLAYVVTRPHPALRAR